MQEFRRAVHDKVIQVGEGLARIFHTRIEQPGGNTVEMPVFIELYARATAPPSATACPELPLHFEALGRRQVVVDCSGGHLSTDGGALLLRSVDHALGLTVRLA